jgi:hypothetical protein
VRELMFVEPASWTFANCFNSKPSTLDKFQAIRVETPVFGGSKKLKVLFEFSPPSQEDDLIALGIGFCRTDHVQPRYSAQSYPLFRLTPTNGVRD